MEVFSRPTDLPAPTSLPRVPLRVSSRLTWPREAIGRSYSALTRRRENEDQISAIGRRTKVAGEDAPLLVVSSGVELGNLLHAVGHHNSNTPDKLIVVFASECRQRHAAPQPGHCALAAQEEGRDLAAARTCRGVGGR